MVVLLEEVEDFLKVLLIEDFYGIGKKIVFKMYELGIFIGVDLYK